MNPILTTITPYWGRPEMLRIWEKAIRGATIPEVQHLIYFVGEEAPTNQPGDLIKYWQCTEDRPGHFSIGHYHNLGARQAETEWIMKMDVDTIPHTGFFRSLMPLLQMARPREWFNCGMFYATKLYSERELLETKIPFTSVAYQKLVMFRQMLTNPPHEPAATNFICRRNEYLELGGSDPRFHGYGWEDYQQIYMLERHWQGGDPLPGDLTLANVTQRCRDEISRPKARQLWSRCIEIALVHRFHTCRMVEGYKTRENTDANRSVLLDYILTQRRQ